MTNIEATVELFHLGVVVGTHGLRGDLKVRPLQTDSRSLLAASEVFLRSPAGTVLSYEPIRTLPQKGNVLMRLRGFETIELAQPLVGCDVLMRYVDLPELENDEFYWYELKGLRVIDRTLGDLGVLDDLLVTGAHDIYVVHGRFGEVMIPAVSQFIDKIDREAGQLLVDLPEGLVSEPHEV